MKPRHFQICYTWAKIGVREGWQVVNASPDIPARAKRNFVASLNHGSTHLSEITGLDPQNRIYEITTDDLFGYATAIQFGMVDRFGRPAFFAHGYVLRWSDIVADPFLLTGISRENFHFTVEETQDMPDALVYDERKTLSDVLGQCSISLTSYSDLIRCIYETFNHNRRSLTVYGDFAEECRYDLIHWIYRGLPYAFRRKFTYSTVTRKRMALKKLFINGGKWEDGNTREWYIDIVSGENDILNEQIRAFQNRYVMAPDLFNGIPSGAMERKITQYFQDAQKKLDVLGIPSSITPEHYEIVLNLLQADKVGKCNFYSGCTSKALLKKLALYIDDGIPQTPLLDGHVSFILKILVARNTHLPRSLFRQIMEMIEDTESDSLKKIGYPIMVKQAYIFLREWVRNYLSHEEKNGLKACLAEADRNEIKEILMKRLMEILENNFEKEKLQAIFRESRPALQERVSKMIDKRIESLKLRYSVGTGRSRE